MGFYGERIFPWVMEKGMSDPRLMAVRKEALASATGRVVEIGLGTGLNLPLYPAAVTELVGVEPNPGMNARAEERTRGLAFPVRMLPIAGEALPLADGSADTVVCTFVLCTIDDATVALREMARVLAPGGRLMVLEHGLHERPGIQRLQRWLNPLQRVVACGCRLDRDISALVEGGGFRWTRLRREAMPGVPATHGYMYLGEATPG
ncbi:MAG: class I SAM-dependent methyltransferase [Deltaproteobacteria bacterium]|nr:class I SAM-dependent methyltransferase [Deltaproteobacteria bacterium]